MRRWIVGLAAVLVLVGVAPASGGTLFEDNFDDGTYADKWDTYNGASFSVEDGAFALDSGFGLDDARAVVKSHLWNTDWKQYTVDFDFKIGQTDYGYGSHFALLFNVQAIAEGYNRGQYYQFYSWLYGCGLHRMENLTSSSTTGLAFTNYGDVGRDDLSLHTWYHARLVVDTSTITGYVGHLDGTYLDTPMFTVDTSGIPADYSYIGPIALKAIGGATNRYDNLVVREIPEPSTLAIWSLLAALGITLGWWRRGR